MFIYNKFRNITKEKYLEREITTKKVFKNRHVLKYLIFFVAIFIVIILLYNHAQHNDIILFNHKKKIIIID